jgi:hypothetical protein
MDGTQWGFNSSFVGFSNPIFVNQFVQGYNVAKKVMNLVIHLYKLLKLKMVKITFCQLVGFVENDYTFDTFKVYKTEALQSLHNALGLDCLYVFTTILYS